MHIITLTTKEMHTYEIIQQVLNKKISTSSACERLDITDRHLRRLKARVRLFGIKGIAHQGRGKASNRKMRRRTEQRLAGVIRKKYKGFGPTLAHEKLVESSVTTCSKSTLRNIMIRNGIWAPKKVKPCTVRSMRLRRAMYGEMVQYDGSYHLWFEGRGVEICLLTAIDDATGKIIHARFDEHEGVFPTFAFWKEYAQKHGLPSSIYHDGFSTYSMNHQKAKENPDTMTQFKRAMTALHVECIRAGSSQAKGRVERLFGTLQDRLVKELRLHNISDVSEANKFLEEKYIPYYNKKFSVVARKSGDAHISLTKEKTKALTSVFSRHTQRVITNDFTVRFSNHIIQLTEKQPVNVYPKDMVVVEEHLDGCWYIRHNSKYLNFKILVGIPKKVDISAPWVLEKNTFNETSPIQMHQADISI